MNFWLDVYNDTMEGEYLSEQQDAREAYDAACRRRQQLIDEAETLCGELEVRKTAALDAGKIGQYWRLERALLRADSRFQRRVAADVEF